MEKVPPLDFESSLADLMRDYLDYLENLGFSIVLPASNLRRLDRFLMEQRIHHPKQIDIRLLMGWFDQEKGRVRANTLRLYRNTCFGLCRYLIRLGHLHHNPVAALPTPRAGPYRPYVFSPPELKRLFDFLKLQVAAAPHGPSLYRAVAQYTLYHLLYACGLRVSEAIRLQCEDYSGCQASLFIRPSKFGKDRLIPIASKVALNIENLLVLRQSLFDIAPQGPIFLLLPAARPLHRVVVSERFRDILRHLGIYRSAYYRQGILHGTPHLHELRRAFAVHRLLRWYHQKVNIDAKLPLLATYMGHGFFGHTKTYLTLTRQLLQQAEQRFAERFDRLDWVKDASLFQ